WQEAVAIPCAQGDVLQFQSVIVVIIDDHNALIDEKNSKYLGVREHEQAFTGYRRLFTELRSMSRVVYGFSDCPERFQMDVKLREDSRLLAGMTV
ncbi:MAG: hypothetical protein ACKPKO_54615, partial [Candidatus Fonsibacter sp.]